MFLLKVVFCFACNIVVVFPDFFLYWTSCIGPNLTVRNTDAEQICGLLKVDYTIVSLCKMNHHTVKSQKQITLFCHFAQFVPIYFKFEKCKILTPRGEISKGRSSVLETQLHSEDGCFCPGRLLPGCQVVVVVVLLLTTVSHLRLKTLECFQTLKQRLL